MSNFSSNHFAIDLKPRRKGTRVSKNRFRASHSRWLIPALLVLLTMGIIIIAGIR